MLQSIGSQRVGHNLVTEQLPQINDTSVFSKIPIMKGMQGKESKAEITHVQSEGSRIIISINTIASLAEHWSCLKLH